MKESLATEHMKLVEDLNKRVESRFQDIHQAMSDTYWGISDIIKDCKRFPEEGEDFSFLEKKLLKLRKTFDKIIELLENKAFNRKRLKIRLGVNYYENNTINNSN